MNEKTKYVKMTGFVLLYIGIFFLNMQLFRFLTQLARQVFPKEIVQAVLGKSFGWIVLFFVVPILLYMLIFQFRRKNFFKFCRFKPLNKRQLIIILFAGISMSLFTIHLINLSFMIKHIPEFKEYINVTEGRNPFFALLMMAVILPTCEEILFRGLIFNEMNKCLPTVAVLFLHTLIYMPFQPNLQVACFAYLNFTIFTLIYIFTGSLWSSILVEVVSALCLFGSKILGIEGILEGASDIYLGIVVIVSAALILIATFSLKQKSFKTYFTGEIPE